MFLEDRSFSDNHCTWYVNKPDSVQIPYPFLILTHWYTHMHPPTQKHSHNIIKSSSHIKIKFNRTDPLLFCHQNYFSSQARRVQGKYIWVISFLKSNVFKVSCSTHPHLIKTHMKSRISDEFPFHPEYTLLLQMANQYDELESMRPEMWWAFCKVFPMKCLEKFSSQDR